MIIIFKDLFKERGKPPHWTPKSKRVPNNSILIDIGKLFTPSSEEMVLIIKKKRWWTDLARRRQQPVGWRWAGSWRGTGGFDPPLPHLLLLLVPLPGEHKGWLEVEIWWGRARNRVGQSSPNRKFHHNKERTRDWILQRLYFDTTSPNHLCTYCMHCTLNYNGLFVVLSEGTQIGRFQRRQKPKVARTLK